MIELARVEMESRFELVLATAPYDRQAQSKRKPSLKIDAMLLLGEIGNAEPAFPEQCQNLVVDSVHMLTVVNPFRPVSSGLYCRFDGVGVEEFHVSVKAHRYESYLAFIVWRTSLDPVPAQWRDGIDTLVIRPEVALSRSEVVIQKIAHFGWRCRSGNSQDTGIKLLFGVEDDTDETQRIANSVEINLDCTSNRWMGFSQ